VQGKGDADSYGVAMILIRPSLFLPWFKVQIYTVLDSWAENRCGLSCFSCTLGFSIIELLVCVLDLYSLFWWANDILVFRDSDNLGKTTIVLKINGDW
jgi:hypothetical protein